ncbi:MAG: nucleotidyltransferase family protein [Candidatus Gastranaerophilales bacterium]|nr:nucleotidyltransferase family protein [Candidatus Gastranaerophilales bacterium]
MVEKSRTENSARNAAVAMTARIIAIVAGYLTRVIFTHTLVEDYVGINGLFTDILKVLALSELGVGTAITYALYKPISERDIEKQKTLMRMYRQFYRIVAGIVLAGGLLVIPFMDVLIKNQPQVEHLIFIYLLYLANSVFSYLLIYKRTLIDAHQLNYIGVLYEMFFLILQNVVQVAILLLTGNFILFVSVQLVCTIASNYCVSKRADRMFPYLRDRQVQELPRQERQSIYQNIRAMLMHRIGAVLVNNTDNMLLSSIVGIASAGRYSNYYLIIGSVRQVLNQIFQGITASVGNLGVEEGRERVRKIFESSFFLGQWLFGLAAICLFEAIDPFVEISFGAQYVFSREITLILCLNFYLTGMRQAVLVFRDSLGLFWYDRYKSIAEAVVNLVVSILLGMYMGTAGIFLGTMVSTVATSLWVEPYILYKHRLKVSSLPYFLRYGLYAAVTFLLWAGEDILCQRITGSLWTRCILRVILCLVVTNLAYLLLYHRTREFVLLAEKAWGILKTKWSNWSTAGKQDSGEEPFGQEAERLLAMLRAELNEERQEKQETAQSGEMSDMDWEQTIAMAKRHSVLPLLYEPFVRDSRLSQKQKELITTLSQKTVLQSYHILFYSKYLIGRLEARGIPVALLKGVGVASFYPVPELRKAGDVDLLLLDLEKLQEAIRVLEESGCQVNKKQIALHHVAFLSGEGMEVELHTMLAEPFDNNRINDYIKAKLPECGRQMQRIDVMGVELPVLTPDFYAYELLLHMLQHFLREGFGLRLLCDWVVFWNHGMEEKYRAQYLILVKESGVKVFSDTVTLACCNYLGLKEECVEWMMFPEELDVRAFMAEVLEAEEFGKSASDRMVALRGGGMIDYIREFHHQMHLNFPRAGRVFLFWPGLWIFTLARFLNNNRKIRNVTVVPILKKARERSNLIAKLKLWE